MSRHPNRQQGADTEEWVVNRKNANVVHVPGEASWYDLRRITTGAKGEVKSTHEKIEGSHNDGNFGELRLWKDQHRSLLSSDASGVAWYHFVVVDDYGTVIKYRKMKPKTVSKIIRESDEIEWRPANHADRDGLQATIPWPEIFDY